MITIDSTARRIIGRITLLFLRALIVPAGLATLLAILAPIWWLADLAVHFRLQYLLIGLVGLVPMVMLKRWWLTGLAAVCIALNIMPAIGYFQPPSPIKLARTQPAPSTESIRIAGLNVFFRNSNYAGVATWMQQDQPDIVVLLEATTKWQTALTELTPEWRYQYMAIKPGRSGKLILSRLPIDQVTTLPSTDVRSPTPVATFKHQGTQFRVAAIHTIWPMGQDRTDARNESLQELGRLAADDGPPLIAVGDFNISPFSPHFEQLISLGSLNRSAAGLGWKPTWPVFLPMAGIQIDHLLVSPAITVKAMKTRSELGSDHRAVIADLKIPL